MKFTSTYKNVRNSDSINANIQETFEKFENYFDGDMYCHATLSKKGRADDNDKCVEITIRSGKYIFRAESTTDSFYKSIDEDFDKIKKQIRRHKDKLLAKRKTAMVEMDMGEEDGDREPLEILRKKRFQVHPMSEEEALLQMELLGHKFFVFMNSETEEMNVVYKRNDEGYGLIELTT